MNEKSVGLKTTSYNYKDIDVIEWDIEIYHTNEGPLIDSNCPFGGKQIGNAKIYFYDASKRHPYNLRMDAHIHTRASQFEILNSVRIFQDEIICEWWEDEDDKSLNEGELDLTDFLPEELECLKSWTEYDEQTLNVYGKLICLDEIKIFPEYRNNGFGSLALQQIIQYFGKIGMDFLLLMPYPIEGNLDDDNYISEQINKLIKFYEKNDFNLTKGKLLERYCMVNELHNLK